MILLLDTHTLIWTFSAPEQLSTPTAERIQNRGDRVYVSTVTLWEIAIKFGSGKLDLRGLTPEELPARIEADGFEILSPRADGRGLIVSLAAARAQGPV